MTKEELIKKAWFKYWAFLTKEDKEEILSNNGYLWRTNDLIYEHEDNNKDFDFKANKGLRPYSLKGIKKNNGWIKIESEEDLPKSIIDCWIMYKDKLYLSLYQSKHFVLKSEFSLLPFNLISHYQPIEKPKPPIF